MRGEASAFIVTFQSSHAAIRAERALKGSTPGLDLIPVPREISSACGFCLLIPVSRSDKNPSEGTDSILHTIEDSVGPGKESLWAVFENNAPNIQRKEKRYERIA